MIYYYRLRAKSSSSTTFETFFNDHGTTITLPYTTNSIENRAGSSIIKVGSSVTFENLGIEYTSYSFRNSVTNDFEIIIIKHSTGEAKKWVVSDDANWPYSLNWNVGAFFPHATDGFANLFMFPTNQAVWGQGSFDRSKLTYNTSTGNFDLESPYNETVEDGNIGQDFSQVFGFATYGSSNLLISNRFGYITVIDHQTDDPSTAYVTGSNARASYALGNNYIDSDNNFWYWDLGRNISKIDLDTFAASDFTLSIDSLPVTYGIGVIGYGSELILPIAGTRKVHTVDISTPASPVMGEDRIYSGTFEAGFTNDTYYAMANHIYKDDPDQLLNVGDEIRVLERHFPIVTETASFVSVTNTPNIKRGSHSFVHNGEMYLLAGNSSGGESLNTLKYNPTTDSWTDLGVDAGDNLFLGKGVFHDNKFYGIGRDDSHIYTYEPPDIAGNATGTWDVISKVTEPPTTVGLGFLVAYDGFLWRWGGSADNSLWKFDLSTETWTDTAAPSPFSGYFSNSMLIGNKVYIFNENSSNISSYVNLDTLTWGTVNELTQSPSNTILAETVLYKDEFIIFVGGDNPGTNSLTVYSTELDEFKNIEGVPNLPFSSQKGNAQIIGSTLYVFRGQGSSGVATADFQKLELKF